ncbi:hypothetical protein CJF32_00000464 [Rutstroemia sp. NJR-2017a WRK4]|nr:hypothetical protein CJF32_00000464 [Rutstroemia sp. NJR-2017a WRK4]
MKFHKACLIFLGIIVGASAPRAAGAWQVVGFYYAYRIMIDAYGVDGNKYIAADARGSLPDNSCTMDEFVRYIFEPHDIVGWPDELIGSSATPDPVDAAAAIEKSAWKTESLYIPQKLLPLLYDASRPSIFPKFEEQVNRMNEYVQLARTTMYKNQVTEAAMAAKPEFKNLKTALIGISQMRRKDIYVDLDGIVTSLENRGIVAVKVQVTAIDGTTFYQLDSAATVEATMNSSDNKLRTFSVSKLENIIKNTFVSVKKHLPPIQNLDKWTFAGVVENGNIKL